MTLLKITVDMFKTTELSHFSSRPTGLCTPIYHTPSVITSFSQAGLPEITMSNACKVESRSCGKQILNLNNTKEATKHLQAKSDSKQEYQFSSQVPSMEQEEEISDTQNK
jgi:hypothetical protein